MREKFLELFNDRHSPASAKYSYEDGLHLSAENDQELVELLADRSNNPDYGYVVRLFQEYRDNTLGSRNGKGMFKRRIACLNSSKILRLVSPNFYYSFIIVSQSFVSFVIYNRFRQVSPFVKVLLTF